MSTDELSAALVATVSPEAATRKAAEAFLAGMEAQPGFAVHLLQMVQQHCVAAAPQSTLIRATAAVYFKNMVKRSWEPTGDEEVKAVEISQTDREGIKAHMVTLLVSCGNFSDVQQQLSAALSIISKSDFPAKWPSLLPEIVTQLESSAEMKTIKGMLITANSILKRFRGAFKSDELYTELKYVLERLAAPLTALFAKLNGALMEKKDDPAQKAANLEILGCLRLCCRIFFSLNWQDLPEFFEDHIAEWMTAFEKYLHLELPLLTCADDEDEEVPPLELVQAAIVENVSLYASKYEEEFQPYVPGFAAAIWGRLMKTSNAARHDLLAATAIRFLAGIIGKQMHSHLFAEQATLRQIVEAIVVPNMSLRDSDIEMFEENPSDYVSADFEAADADTRRRGARDLVTAMCKHHDEATTAICGEHVARMIASYAADKQNCWRLKDAALHLIVAVTVRAESQERGVSQTSARLNIVQLFDAHVLPELRECTLPVILADAIKFACTFRNQLPQQTLVALLPLLCRHLGQGSPVVQTYAAACLERLLSIQGGDPAHAITKEHIDTALLGALFEALFKVLETKDGFLENEYVMKAVMRLLVVTESSVLPVASVIIEKLTWALGRVCANPRNPRFNHYLFESLAVLLRVACVTGGAAMAQKFEALLFPPFQSVLQLDVVEFAPYVFQLLALLLEFQRGAPLSAAYVALLPPLLHPSLWERRGNVPGLTGLLEEYLQADAPQIVARNQLEPLLGVFQKLLATKATEPCAFALLRAVVCNIPLPTLEKYFSTIFQLLLTRLQHNRDRAGYVHGFVAMCGLLAGKHGAPLLVERLEGASQPGMTATLAMHIWLPAFANANFSSPTEAKCAAVGLTRLLCEKPESLCANGSDAWSAVLSVVQKALEKCTAKSSAASAKSIGLVNSDDVDALAASGFDSQFAKLVYGSKKTDDAFAEIADVRPFVLGTLANLTAAQPQFGPIIQTVGLR